MFSTRFSMPHQFFTICEFSTLTTKCSIDILSIVVQFKSHHGWCVAQLDFPSHVTFVFLPFVNALLLLLISPPSASCLEVQVKSPWVVLPNVTPVIFYYHLFHLHVFCCYFKWHLWYFTLSFLHIGFLPFKYCFFSTIRKFILSVYVSPWMVLPNVMYFYFRAAIVLLNQFGRTFLEDIFM